jgi:hypothetical protein
MTCRIAALLVLTPYGMTVAVAGAMLPTLVAAPLYWHAMRRHVAVSWPQILSAVLRTAGVTIATILPAALMRALNLLDGRPALQIALTLAFAAPLWLGSVYLFRHPLKDEVTRLWDKLAPGVRGRLAAAE